MMLTLLFAVLFYLATAVCVLGVLLRLRRYMRIAVPFKIPTMPAPTTQFGVALRLLREVVLFESLFKASKWTWVFGWLFHFGLLVVILRHLRFFAEPVLFWVEWLQRSGALGGLAMLVGLFGLFARRLLVDRVRYISAPSDYLMLVLLLAIGLSGALMKVVWQSDLVAVKQFCLGLLTFTLHNLPAQPILLLHLAGVIVLLLIFPFSKLLHGPGLFFSPTRNQVDDSRERRHTSR